MGDVLTPEERDAFERLFRADYDCRVRRAICRAALGRLVAACSEPLVLNPAEPQPDAPTDIALLPDYWDERRRKQGKPDLSRCAAELRIALRNKG